MEAYQPLQIASICYEVTKLGLTKPRQQRFKKMYVKKIIRALEKNCLNVADPQMDKHEKRY
jgi:hypothetical protein